VALTSGLGPKPWGPAWIQARADAGLQLGPGLPALPAPSLATGWTRRPLTTGEATLWLRELLVRAGGSAAEAQRLTSHSLKCTVLSWAAKYGLDISERRILGHHFSSTEGSAVTYSRDAMVAPLRSVQVMLAAIAAGSFMPDHSRAAYFLAPPYVPDGEVEPPIEWEYDEEGFPSSRQIPPMHR